MREKILKITLLGGLTLACAAVCCIGCGGDECCTKDNKTLKTNGMETKDNASCDHCGKNSCDRSCADAMNGKDTSLLKESLPSCSLSGKELSARKEELQAGLARKVKRVEEMETGFDLVFEEPVEYSTDLLGFINFERGCCSGFTYALIFEPHNKATHLQIYGSKEIKEEIRQGFTELGLLK